jgi:hypothetical protein
MSNKCKKRWYTIAAIAEEERQRLIAIATDKPRAKQLVVYCCRDCNLFHIGHLRRRLPDTAATPKPAPATSKPPTAGQIRRAGKRLEKDTKHVQRATDYVKPVGISTTLESPPTAHRIWLIHFATQNA